MKEIVEIYKGEPRAGTWLISQGFKRRHAEILKTCRKYESEFLELGESKGVSNTFTSRKIPKEKGGKGGQPIVEYLLNEAQTIFLGTLFRAKSGNDPVLRFKVKLAKDFIRIKRILSKIAADLSIAEGYKSFPSKV